MQKFFSKKVEFDGHKFDSIQEKDRYVQLRLLERSGEISNLELQKEFEIIPTLYKEVVVHMKTKDKVVLKVDEKRAVYTCDFYYYDNSSDAWIIEEYKSPMTAKLADYVLRRKLIKRMIDEWNKEGGSYVFKEVISSYKKKRK